jgi:diacylglycerol kinase (ATP)
MKVTFVYNSDAGVDDQPSKREILHLIRHAGHDVHEVSLRDACWEQALQQPVDVVAVAGGDGTVGQVVKCLMRVGAPIAVLPVGTANNIAKTLGLMDRPLNQLIADWTSARRVKLDVGTATGPWGSKYFVEGIGIGLFTGTMSRLDATGNIEIAHCENPEQKMTSVLEILDHRLSTYPAQLLELTLDGEFISGAYILLEVMNTRFVGPNLLLARDADASDGLFDIVFLSAGERRKLSRYLHACMRGKSSTPRWPVRRASHIRMEWKGFAVHIDDEVWPDRGGAFTRSSMTIEVTANRHAVEFLASR